MIEKRRDHGLLYRVGMHHRRKEIIAILLHGPKSIDEVARITGLDEWKVKFHLDMLIQVGFVEVMDGSYALIEDGVDFATKVLEIEKR